MPFLENILEHINRGEYLKNNMNNILEHCEWMRTFWNG